MKYPDIFYDPETDTLGIEFSGAERKESYEVAPGVWVTVGKDDDPVLIEFMGPVREWFAPLISQVRETPEPCGGTDFPEVSYVPEEDVLAVQLTAEPIKHTIESAPGVYVSVNKENEPVLIEFLGPVREWFAPVINQERKAAQEYHSSRQP
jgi:uncharacterized protein YuzE